IDLKSLLRQGVKTTEIKEKVAQLLAIKPEINYKQRDSGNDTGIYNRTMSQIGG
ncbi:MAG: cyclic pyranopterin phosphate synthase MoaA, partial [Crocosphaera sp.]